MMPAHEYVQQVILHHLKEIEKFVGRIKQNGDVEDVHQARLAIRQLLNDFSLFKKIYSASHVKKFKSRFKLLFRDLGCIRDLDVKIKSLNQLTSHPAIKPGLKVSLKKLDLHFIDQRAILFPRVFQHIALFKKKNVISKARLYFQSETSQQKNKDDALKKLSRTLILKRVADLQSFDGCVTAKPQYDHLHRMRIAAKKLRYTLECFQPVYKKDMKEFIVAARCIQDVLGKIHDYVVWVETTADSLSRQQTEEVKEGMDYFLKFCKLDRKKCYQEFIHLWSENQDKKVWKRLIQCIA